MDITFFERYSNMPEELLQRYSVLSKFDSIDSVVNNFPTTAYVGGQLAKLELNPSESEYRNILGDKEVARYLDALTK
jgi:hypothetical protein